ncbi:Transmembrane emp24 domain-containing protein p24delta9 [Raphanus sativus]|uniref:Transmembrane emp24 domain-containing protein p24delta9 n=1 Tax=Raphanus sativus TaxID=3726 RepID=A0A6J0N6X7_RAPSA|nr:transmembrane emp24 domain-containing protein p24delta9 [Raphanus sativus]KAJ4916581.1 Transmembrane emp24 domain-containing protein p24delta9 [Raphanus sativus]
MVLRSENTWTFLLTLAILSGLSQSLHFELRSGRTKCISEDIKSNSMTVGKYTVVKPDEAHPSPPSHKISIRVTSSYGNTFHHAEDVDSGQFAFTAVEAGDYMACFTANGHKPEVTLSIDFDWRTGIHSKSWSSVAKKSQVEVMEFEVKQLIETVNTIHDEMFYLRDREEEMQNLNRATISKMAWLSFLSLFVCLGVAGMQFMHLKTFLEKKKVI